MKDFISPSEKAQDAINAVLGLPVEFSPQKWKPINESTLCSGNPSLGPSGNDIWIYFRPKIGEPYISHYMNWSGYRANVAKLIERDAVAWCDVLKPNIPGKSP